LSLSEATRCPDQQSKRDCPSENFGMSRAVRIALFAGVLALIILAGAASLIVSQTKVSPDAIHSSVIRSEAGVDKAWKLPAASTFRRELTWQSNPSLCGPASIANALRSLGETA